MSETKFTPGPWCVSHANGYEYNIGIQSDHGERWHVCDVCDDAYDINYQANANLIAAAPELYEELESRLCQTRCGCGHPACSRCEDDKETELVLAKARGEV